MKERLSNKEFKLMQGVMGFMDKIHPHVSIKADAFGIQRGMTVVDYGCGPGRYTVEFARLVGSDGKVYAVDLLDIALSETQKRLDKIGIKNVTLKLAHGYDTGIGGATADIVFAIDMFHHVSDSNAFLNEIYRITKPSGLLVLSGGHMSRKVVKERIAASKLWEIANESRHITKYKKRKL